MTGEPEFVIDWTRASTLCPHCKTSLEAEVGGASEEGIIATATRSHCCNQRFAWYQDQLAAAMWLLAEARNDLKKKAVWFQTVVSPAPEPDEYRSGPVVSEADLARLANRRYAKAEDERDSDAWDQAIGALLGPAATYEQVADWVEEHRTHSVIESDTDTRQALVASLRRLASHMRSWDVTITELTATNDRSATLMAEYRAGLRQAVAIAFLGTGHTDRVDEWVAGLLDTDETPETPPRLSMPNTDELEM